MIITIKKIKQQQKTSSSSDFAVASLEKKRVSITILKWTLWCCFLNLSKLFLAIFLRSYFTSFSNPKEEIFSKIDCNSFKFEKKEEF